MNRLPVWIALFACSVATSGQADVVADPSADVRHAQPIPLERAPAEDALLDGLVIELERSMKDLRLEGFERPYFLAYGVIDVGSVQITAQLGAVTQRVVSPLRTLRADVRVGSYELDNTNFGRGGAGAGMGSLPIENDPLAIRKAIWWTTDRAYKQVVEGFERKKAFMESKIIEDKPDDFARAEAEVYLEPLQSTTIPTESIEALAIELSRIFRDYPLVQDSAVRVQVGAGQKYVVNSEGTRVRVAGATYQLEARARVQADDGMIIKDAFTVWAESFDELPDSKTLAEKCRSLAEDLIAIRQAPRLEESYTGPVLVDAPAAASLFFQQFGRRFAGGQRPVGSRTDPEDFENKLNKRILPRHVAVIDNPTQRSIDDEFAAGHYPYDDEGVPGQPVQLVQKGRLIDLLMSRNPSKVRGKSNGHGRGFMRPRAAVGNLILSSSDPMDEASLRQEFLEACADEDLAYGLRIESLARSAPVAVFKVLPDGSEHRVRGVELVKVDLKAFKRMLAVGGEKAVANFPARGVAYSCAAPAMLFEELDLTPVDRDFDKPPSLPSPVARANE